MSAAWRHDNAEKEKGRMSTMKIQTAEIFDELLARHPKLGSCRRDIETAFGVLYESFRSGGKLLVCGNGGSAATLGFCIAYLFVLGLFANKRAHLV